MNSLRCSNCSFLNFATANTCKRCNAALNSPAEVAAVSFFGESLAGLPPGYQTASNNPQPTYLPQYFPTPIIAPLPSKPRSSGTTVLLISLLVVAVVVAASIGVLWKFGKPTSINHAWHEYQPQDDSFTVLMPTKPVETVQNRATSAGELKMHLSIADFNQRVALLVGYADYPETYKDIPAQQLLDVSTQGALSSSRTTLVSKKNISLDGYPGVELELLPTEKIPGGGRAVTRIYWVAPRIYIMYGGGPKSSETDAALAKFLDSFKLRKKQA